MQRRAAEESLTDHGKDNSNGRAHVGDAIRHKPGILGFLRQIGFMGATTVHTDELKSYNGLSKAGFEHETVNHGAGEYVDGDCHVNGIEGFWARLKLSIRGTHVHVSAKHLQKYVKEFEYRYNRRGRPDAIFGDLVASL